MLLGRRVELARIQGILDAAVRGNGGALIVHGDPGIGKTSLLEQFTRELTSATLLTVRPLQAESELPFAGLADLLHPLLGRLDELPPPQAAALAGALAIGPPTAGDRFAAAAGTLSLLGRAGETRPVVAVVDDAHWLDDASRQALLFAARRLADDHVVLLIGTRYRPWLDEARIPLLELQGLSAESCADLVAQQGRPIAPGVLERLLARAQGNPLALRETIRGLSDEELAGASPLPDEGLPTPGVPAFFTDRLERQPEPTRRALLLAAASDTGDAAEIARALVSAALPADALTPAERAGLIATYQDRVTFLHPLLRTAAYERGTAADRRSAHAALARSLSTDSQAQQPDSVAWHLARAAPGPDEQVALQLDQAASRARERHGYGAAARALTEAARLSVESVGQVQRLIGAANAFRLGGHTEQSLESCERALDITADPLARADIRQLMGSVLISTRPMTDVYATLVDEADRVEQFDIARAATLLAVASIGAIGSVQLDMAIETAGRAAELSAQVGGPAALLGTIALSFALTLSGRVSEGLDAVGPWIPMLDALDPLSDAGILVVMLTHMFIWTEDWPTATRLMDRILAEGRGASALTVLAHPLAMQCELHLRRGRLAAAYATALESVHIARDIGQGVDSTFGLAGLAQAEALLGREDDCRLHAEQCVEAARRLGMVSMETYAAAALGSLELALSRPERAVPHLEVCLHEERVGGVGIPTAVMWNGDLIEAYVRIGRLDDAAREIERLAGQARRAESRWAAAIVERYSGVLAGNDDYEGHFAAARALHGDIEPWELARTELCLGRRRRRARRPSEARTALRQALSRFETVGSEPWAEQTRVELRALGDRPQDAAPRQLTDLTPQELQVAMAVASGATNNEAGAALFISHAAHLSVPGHGQPAPGAGAGRVRI